MAALHVRATKSLEIIGSIAGGALIGSFHTWVQNDNARHDERIGPRTVSSIRVGQNEYMVNESGDVRQLHGVLERRQRTQDFIDDEDFVSQPQFDKLQGLTALPDGRQVYDIDLSPPDGQPETLDLDAKTLMIDRISYDEDDGVSTEDYYNYGVFRGALIAAREVDSNGDHDFDLTHLTRHITVDGHIDPSVFLLPPSTVVQADKPVTVPIREEQGHWYAQVHIGSKDYMFLLDTGAQMIALDTRVAREQGLKVSGRLQVAGAQRVGGLGFAALDAIDVGGVKLPVRSVSVLDLHGSTGAFDADGVLGYPFFAAAEVTIDPISRSMTFGKPGSLHPDGIPFAIDVDRQLVEMPGVVNHVDGNFVVDTGNSTEMLLYEPFMRTHPYIVPLQDREHAASDFGVGGSASASFGYVDELDIGPFRLYNRYANIMLGDRGAFADRFDAGNIGMGVLKNFVVTFDEANEKMFAEKSSAFDDGRYRRRPDNSSIMGL